MTWIFGEWTTASPCKDCLRAQYESSSSFPVKSVRPGPQMVAMTITPNFEVDPTGHDPSPTIRIGSSS